MPTTSQTADLLARITRSAPRRAIVEQPAPTKTSSTQAPSTQADEVFRLDQPIIITIDGPAGTGKSSVARELAARLGLDFLDTGAMYRAAAAIMLDRGIPIDNTDELVATVADADLHFDWAKDPPTMLAWLKPIDSRIRAADVTAIVSRVASIGRLREHMVQKQRIIARQHPRLVSEGRDQGSVVFPDATLKFYLDADAQVRARRRADQLRADGITVDEQKLLREIIERDRSDMSRTDGPLVKPDNAVVLDTSNLPRHQVVEKLEEIVRRKANEP